MRISHFVPLRGAKIDVYRELISDLGIRNECQLYALELNTESQLTLIFSTIPPEIWKRAYKLAIYLAKKPGTMAEAARSISDLGINIFSSCAGSINASGAGCWTSVVELPENVENIDKAKEAIQKKLEADNLLIKADEFENGLEKVILNPLKILNNLYSHVNIENEFAGPVDNYYIDLEKFNNNNGKNLFDSVIVPHYTDKDIQVPNHCLVTPDTEEKHIRVAFLPENVNMIQISLKIEIRSLERKFSGYFASVLEALTDLRFNIYSADNFMLKKEMPNPNSDLPTEIASFVFTVDSRKSRVPKPINEMKDIVFNRIKRKVESQAANLEGKGSMKLIDDGFEIVDILALSQRCFFATNARKQIPEHRYYAREIIAALRSLRLDPINVEITKSKRRRVIDDVMPLLTASPMVVSLHMPVDENRLADNDRLKCIDPIHCPSDWVLFEEAFLSGMNRPVFRILHKNVREPRYARGEREFEFDSRASFDNTLQEVIRQIKTHMTTEDYSIDVRESEEVASRIKPMLLRRNIDKEFAEPVPTTTKTILMKKSPMDD